MKSRETISDERAEGERESETVSSDCERGFFFLMRESSSDF